MGVPVPQKYDAPGGNGRSVHPMQLTSEGGRRWLWRLLEPAGGGGLRDHTVLRLWDAYAAANGAALAARRGRTARPAVPPPPPAPYDRAFFRDHMLEELLPFWARHGLDAEHGGFFTHLDRQGNVYEPSYKRAVMQARMIFAFAKGYAASGDERWRVLAEQGVRFLLRHFWDRERGGWFRGVYRDGRPEDRQKHSADQAYVLLGLAECHRATGDREALDHALATRRLLDEHVWDPEHGGYYESMNPDWSVRSSRKTICVHLDCLKALMALDAVGGGGSSAREVEVADLIVARFQDPRQGCVLEKFQRGWSYSPLSTWDRLELGHNLKACWILLDMAERHGRRDYRDVAKRLLDFSVRHGWDEERGGFYQYLFRNGRLASDEKLWWSECEGLSALARMHALSGDPIYRDLFDRLASFCVAHFVDREFGEWYTACHGDGRVADDRKGGDWKAAYHTVAACAYILQHLRPRDHRIADAGPA